MRLQQQRPFVRSVEQRVNKTADSQRATLTTTSQRTPGTILRQSRPSWIAVMPEKRRQPLHTRLTQKSPAALHRRRINTMCRQISLKYGQWRRWLRLRPPKRSHASRGHHQRTETILGPSPPCRLYLTSFPSGLQCLWVVPWVTTTLQACLPCRASHRTRLRWTDYVHRGWGYQVVTHCRSTQAH